MHIIDLTVSHGMYWNCDGLVSKRGRSESWVQLKVGPSAVGQSTGVEEASRRARGLLAKGGMALIEGLRP
jgi:hypothetical protein